MNGLLLPDPMDPPDGLLLYICTTSAHVQLGISTTHLLVGIPPRFEQDDVVARRDVEPGAARLDGHEQNPASVVCL